MAAVVPTDTITIEINDIPVEVPKGELIVEAVKRIGLEIPVFCYHPRMKPVGMCRMCLVEVGFKQADGSVRKMPKPQAGCTLPASEGMVIYTDSELVHKDRRGVLEFLLVNHPLDCPICDRGGECPLQNNTIFYGPSTSRYQEIKRHLPKAFPLSQYVTLDLERCIQCGRCVRFTEEISGDHQLAFRFRGANMQPSTFELRDFTSKFSGNVIEICPVGALTSAEYRFRARPWDLQTKPAVCLNCSNGCNIWFDHRVGKMVRINGRTNDQINEEWTCDKGKFGHEFYNAENRLNSPFIRQNDSLMATSWENVYQPILDQFLNGKEKVAALMGHNISNEGAYLFQKLIRDGFGSQNIDSRTHALLPKTKSGGGPSAMDGLPVPFARAESNLADLELKDAILVFGTSLSDELPMVFLRARKGWLNQGTKVIVATPQTDDADHFAELTLRYTPGTEAQLAKAIAAAKTNSGDLNTFASECGVSADEIKRAAELLSGNSAVITSTSLLNAPQAGDAWTALTQMCQKNNLEWNMLATGGNEFGALLNGAVPNESGMNTVEVLTACSEGKIKALWLCGMDPFNAGLPRDLVEKALENVEFLVYQGIAESEAMAYASVVLPITAPAEEDGTWTNCFGVVQKMNAILPAKGTAKPAWRVANEFLLRSGSSLQPFFNATEVAEAAAAGS